MMKFAISAILASVVLASSALAAEPRDCWWTGHAWECRHDHPGWTEHRREEWREDHHHGDWCYWHPGKCW
jgi:hypothetical protein